MGIEYLRILSVGQVPPHLGWGMPPHCHPFYELISVSAGAFTVTTLRGRVVAGAGDVLLYPAGVVHGEQSHPDHPVHTFSISFTWPDAVPDLPLITRDADGRLCWLLRWMYDIRFVPGARAQAVRDSMMQTLLAEYLRLIAYEEPDMVERTRRFVRQHLAEALSLDRLADHSQMSKFHFVRCYKRLAGVTPMDDVRRLRVEAARDLLLATDFSLTAIANRVGLADDHHLARLLRRYLQMSAGELRHRPARTRSLLVEDAERV